MAAINTYYTNFFLSNEVEDAYNSQLDLARFCTVDNGLVGTPGMQRQINIYKTTGTAQDVALGEGNTQSLVVSYENKPYNIKTVQARFEYLDEEAMADPMVPIVGVRNLAIEMFNHVNADIFAEFNKTTNTVSATAPNFDAFVDAAASLQLESIEGVEMFAFVNPADMGKLRKAMKDTLQYVEAFARQGYVGTCAGINIYTKKDAVENTIVGGTREAVTLFNKKGAEVEQIDARRRDAGDANIRKNTIFTRKFYIAALTHPDKAFKITVA